MIFGCRTHDLGQELPLKDIIPEANFSGNQLISAIPRWKCQIVNFEP